jgi:hypothetical protein
MSWFGNNDDKQKDLLKRDWSGRASHVENSLTHAGGTVEVHKTLQGTFEVTKNWYGNVVSVKKK